MATQTMKAVNYQGPFKVKVEEIELPKLQHPDDVIVKVTTVSSTFVLLFSMNCQLIHSRPPFAVPTCSMWNAFQHWTILTPTQHV